MKTLEIDRTQPSLNSASLGALAAAQAAARGVLALGVAASVCACAPLAGDDVAPSSMVVRISPDGTPADMPRVVRLEVGVQPDTPELADVHLVVGDISSSHLGQFARDDLSQTLTERIVPTVKWRDGDNIVLAPTVLLDPGETYHAVVGSRRLDVALRVRREDALPLLDLVWPPDGIGSGETMLVWCGAQPLPPMELPVVLAPTGVTSALVSGVSTDGDGASCVRAWVPRDADGVVTPPAVVGPEGWPFARLEPVQVSLAAESPQVDPLVCPLGELPVGDGCVYDIADDRLRLRGPEAPRLWWFNDGLQLDLVAASRGEPLVVKPLTPGTPSDVRWGMIDLAGRGTGGQFRVFTQAPMAHVVITEVYANPVGPEPEQEWVELYNDGLAPADLGELMLIDIGGETPLPPGVVLMPGAYAVVVNKAYDDGFAYDPTPAEGTLIVRVDELGKNGLKNDGEPIDLAHASLGVVSRFPPLPKPKSGESVQRRSPAVLVHEADGFVRSAPTPGAPFIESPTEDEG